MQGGREVVISPSPEGETATATLMVCVVQKSLSEFIAVGWGEMQDGGGAGIEGDVSWEGKEGRMGSSTSG